MEKKIFQLHVIRAYFYSSIIRVCFGFVQFFLVNKLIIQVQILIQYNHRFFFNHSVFCSVETLWFSHKMYYINIVTNKKTKKNRRYKLIKRFKTYFGKTFNPMSVGLFQTQVSRTKFRRKEIMVVGKPVIYRGQTK